MSVHDLCLFDAHLPSGERASIYISGRHISGTEPGLTQTLASKMSVNCQGNYVLPGLIDTHVHFREPGGERKETWDHGEEAALRGGVTTVIEMPNTDPPTTTHEALAQKIERVGIRRINYSFRFGATPDNYSEIESALKDPYCEELKIFMGSSTGNLLVDKTEDIEKHFRKRAELNQKVAVHAEDENMMRRKRELVGQNPTFPEHCVIRDKHVEISAVKKALILQERTGVDLYFCHVSRPESLEMIHDALQAGQNVSAEVCPHHLFLSDTYMAGVNGGFFKMNPPLRSEPDRIRMLELLSRDDFVRSIGSDHAPHMIEEKRSGHYDSTPSGVPGVQTILPTLYSLVINHQISMERLVELTSGFAGRRYFNGRKGQIKVGADADLIIFNPEPEHVIRHHEMASKMKWTPFNGFQTRGKVVAAYVGGGLVYTA